MYIHANDRIYVYLISIDKDNLPFLGLKLRRWNPVIKKLEVMKGIQFDPSIRPAGLWCVAVGVSHEISSFNEIENMLEVCGEEETVDFYFASKKKTLLKFDMLTSWVDKKW